MIGEASFAIGPLAYAISVETFRAWLTAAGVGERIVYAHGSVPPRGESSWKLAGQLAEERRVTLISARADGRTQWIAVKCAAPALPSATAESVKDKAAVCVLSALAGAAAQGLPCPTDAEIAVACGLKDAEAARWRRRKLEAAGEIRTELRGPTERKIVTIVATGKSTVPGAL